MKKAVITFATFVLSVMVVSFPSFAENDYQTSFSSYGLKKVDFDTDYMVITEDSVYNKRCIPKQYVTSEELDASIEFAQNMLAEGNTSICAIHKSLEYEIDIDFVKSTLGLDFSIYKGYSETRLKRIFSLEQYGLDMTSISYVEMGQGIPMIKIEGNIPAQNEAVALYTCMAAGKDEKYQILFKLYTYNGEPLNDAHRTALRSVVDQVEIALNNGDDSSSAEIEKEEKDDLHDLDKLDTTAKSIRTPEDNKNYQTGTYSYGSSNTLLGNVVSKGVAGAIIGVIAVIISMIRARKKTKNKNMLPTNKIPANKMTADGRKKYCINCGEPLPEDALFCSSCGTRQTNGPGEDRTNTGNSFATGSREDILRMVMQMQALKSPSEHFASGAVFDISRKNRDSFYGAVSSFDAGTLHRLFANSYMMFLNNPQIVGFPPFMVDQTKNDTNPATWNADIFELEHGDRAALLFMPVRDEILTARVVGIIFGSKGDGYYFSMISKDGNQPSEVCRNKAAQGVEKVGAVKGLGFELMNGFLNCIKNDYYRSV